MTYGTIVRHWNLKFFSIVLIDLIIKIRLLICKIIKIPIILNRYFSIYI